MKAVVVRETGGPEVMRLETVADPEPGPDQVLIEVRAAAVNPIDWKYRRGVASTSLPMTPGIDVSGVVKATRSSDFAVGEEVCGFTISGGYAQLATADARHLVHKPADLDHEMAASVPVSGMTAWQALSSGGEIADGITVLVNGAAGGVGHLAVQFAALAGDGVIGVGSGRNRDFVLGLGANQYVDYTIDTLSSVVPGADVVIDTVGGDSTRPLVDVIDPGGRFVSVIYPEPVDWPITQALVHAASAHSELVVMRSNRSQLRHILDLMASGVVRVEMASILPLQDSDEAQRLSESGHTRGKIVLVPSQP